MVLTPARRIDASSQAEPAWVSVLRAVRPPAEAPATPPQPPPAEWNTDAQPGSAPPVPPPSSRSRSSSSSSTPPRTVHFRQFFRQPALGSRTVSPPRPPPAAPPPRAPPAQPAAQSHPEKVLGAACGQRPPRSSSRKPKPAATRVVVSVGADVYMPADALQPQDARTVHVVVPPGGAVGATVGSDLVIESVSTSGELYEKDGDAAVGCVVLALNGRDCDSQRQAVAALGPGGWAERVGSVTLTIADSPRRSCVRRAASMAFVGVAALDCGAAQAEAAVADGLAARGEPARCTHAGGDVVRAVLRSPAAAELLIEAGSMQAAGQVCAVHRTADAAAGDRAEGSPRPRKTVSFEEPRLGPLDGVSAAVAAAALAAALVPALEGMRTAAADAALQEEDYESLLVTAYDLDRDSTLSYTEFLQLCHDLGRPMPGSEQEFESLCRVAGETGPGLTAAGLRRLGGLERPTGKMQRMASLAVCRRAAAATSSSQPGPGKTHAQAAGVSAQRRVDLPNLAAKLRQLWEAKPGDVVDELCANLCFPARAREFRVALLAEAARAAARRMHADSASSPVWTAQRKNLAEALVMMLYTMAGPDIDATLSFTDVPDFARDGAVVWERYRRHHPWRNGALFSIVNWSMRGAAERTHGRGPSWEAVRRWAKTITLLTALAAARRGGFERDSFDGVGECVSEGSSGGGREEDAPTTAGVDTTPAASSVEPRRMSSQTPPRPLLPHRTAPLLFRGLAALPPDVYKSFATLKAGDPINWPAPSSTATTREPAEAYLMGNAANAQAGDGGRVFFTIHGADVGLELAEVSKYPREQEVLLPPFSSFTVTSVAVLAEAQANRLPTGTVTIDMVYEGTGVPGLRELLSMSLRDAEAASRRLEAADPVEAPVQAAAPGCFTPRRHTNTFHGFHTPSGADEPAPQKLLSKTEAELICEAQDALTREFGSLRGAWSRMNIRTVAGRKDGVLDADEFHWGLAQVGLGGYAAQLLAALDKNADGELAFREFAALGAKAATVTKAGQAATRTRSTLSRVSSVATSAAPTSKASTGQRRSAQTRARRGTTKVRPRWL